MCVCVGASVHACKHVLKHVYLHMFKYGHICIDMEILLSVYMYPSHAAQKVLFVYHAHANYLY